MPQVVRSPKTYDVCIVGSGAGGGMPTLLRRESGPVTVKPEQAKIAAYFNVDNGSGKIRGVYLQENAAVAPIFETWMKPFHDLGMFEPLLFHRQSHDRRVDAVAIAIPAEQIP